MIRQNSLAILAYFKKDRNGLITADHHFDLAYLRNYLVDKKIHTEQYLEQNLKLFEDLLDDLTTLDNNIYIFYIDEKNDHITQMVSQRLKRINSKYIIIWVGVIPINDDTRNSIRDKHDIFIFTESIAANTFNKIVEIINIDRDSVYSNIPTHYIYSPYKNGSIQARLVNYYGVRLNTSCFDKTLGLDVAQNNVKQLREDFRMFQSYGVEGTIPFLDQDMLEQVELFDTLMDLIDPESYSFSFAGKVSLRNLSNQILHKLIHNQFNHLEILVHDLSDEEAIASIEKIHNTLASNKLSIIFNINFSLENGNVEHIMLKQYLNEREKIGLSTIKVNLSPPIEGRLISNQIEIKYEYSSYMNNYLHLYQTDSRPESALVNGHTSYLTGFYPYHFKGGSSKHIAVEEQFLDPVIYRDLGKFLGINSAIIYHSNQSRTVHKENILYSKDDGYIRERDDIYERNKVGAMQEGTFLPHYHQVYKTEEDYIDKLQIDDHHHTAHINILKAPYKKAKAVNLLEDNNFLFIEKKEDLLCFLQDVDHFLRTGSFRHPYEISSFLMDGCRWGGPEHCTITKLHRFSLDNKQQIIPCGGCSKAIGSSSDSYINVVGKAFQLTDEEKEIRGCNTCPVNNSCSKCAMLPDFMDREQYCELRRRQPNIDEYVNATNIIRSLVQAVPIFKKATIDDLKVSTSLKSHLISGDSNPSMNSLEGHLYLIILQDTPFIVEGRSFKIVKINVAAALVFEGLLKGISGESIKEELMEKFQLHNERADSLYKKTIEKLLELNYLNYKKVPSLL